MRREVLWGGALAAVTMACGTFGASISGCLDRPVASSNPSTKSTFTVNAIQQSIDKIDLLFVIDNSASMGDKQAYLEQAVPDLITRLVTPNCVDSTTSATPQTYGSSDINGNCAKGVVEFPPVHDMHIGVISTSLGERLGNVVNPSCGQSCTCNASYVISTDAGTLNTHNDDKAELLNRAGPNEVPLADLGTVNYLNWFPSTAANQNASPSPGAPPITDPAKLEADFAQLISGLHQYGCGIESQLESFYRFLIQPDPYASMALANKKAQWVGVDTTILQQRKSFLRPDSLVAIIDLTDEDDSEIDVRAYGGQGYLWMNTGFDPPHGTQGCAENPSNSGLEGLTACTSCDFAAAGDPNCQAGMNAYSDPTDWGYNLNLRHVHMQQKYGIWPQFPLQRYVLGLTSPKVPDRNGEYPPGANSYQGTTNLDCTNPLFASALPDGSNTDPATLCHLPPGPRTADLIYFAHIGGVPHQLLQQDPSNPESPLKETLMAEDWVKILGNLPAGKGDPTNPASYDFTGADPHMLESYQPRSGPGLAAPTSPDNADPVSGREWITDQGGHSPLVVDREYACTFPLTQTRQCVSSDPTVIASCDCQATGLTYEQSPPICCSSAGLQQQGSTWTCNDGPTSTNETTQYMAKAYPTTRELLLANLVGKQGIVSSICPIHVTPANGDMPPDPLFGYRPAVSAIVDRLKTSIVKQCLPHQVSPDSSGVVPCLVLVTLPTPGDESACSAAQGLSVPQADILARFRQTQEDEWKETNGAASNVPEPNTLPVCQLLQLTPSTNPGDFANRSCANSPQAGWCYVTGPSAGNCPQGIQYSNGSPPSNAQVRLQCIEDIHAVVDGG